MCQFKYDKDTIWIFVFFSRLELWLCECVCVCVRVLSSSSMFHISFLILFILIRRNIFFRYSFGEHSRLQFLADRIVITTNCRHQSFVFKIWSFWCYWAMTFWHYSIASVRFWCLDRLHSFSYYYYYYDYMEMKTFELKWKEKKKPMIGNQNNFQIRKTLMNLRNVWQLNNWHTHQKGTNPTNVLSLLIIWC